MRSPPLPPPPSQELQRREIHELVRDYPELLPCFRAMGVDLRKDGGTSLEELGERDDPEIPGGAGRSSGGGEVQEGGEEAGPLLEALAWRRSAQR